MSKTKQLIPLCNVDDIAHESSQGFSHDGANFFVVKKDGVVYAYKNACPHLGIPLEMQQHQFLDGDNAFIQCSTHGAIFTIEEGLCIAGPCQGQFLQQLDVEVCDNQVSVDIAPFEE